MISNLPKESLKLADVGFGVDRETKTVIGAFNDHKALTLRGASTKILLAHIARHVAVDIAVKEDYRQSAVRHRLDRRALVRVKATEKNCAETGEGTSAPALVFLYLYTIPAPKTKIAPSTKFESSPTPAV